jgi:hypothetical protein
VKPSDEAKQLHERVDWLKLRDLREIDGLGARALEVLKGARAAGVNDFISSTILHQVIYIQGGKGCSSTPSNISTALQKFRGPLEKRHLDSLKFRFPEPPNAHLEATHPQIANLDDQLLLICNRFHRATVHLTHRRKGRPTIDFSDEYDVQDVFGTVLKCFYEDVRDEEWTPSYAGKAAKIDFVISDTRTATELKRARPKQQIDEELTIDIAKYAKRPDIDRLVCFVYDPDGVLTRDAVQIEKDLSDHRTHNGHGLDVTVLIRPK